MNVNRLLLKLILTIFLSAFFLTACSSAPSRGAVGDEIGRHIKLGATKDEVLKYAEGCEINGTKAISSGYLKTDKGETVIVNGKKVEVAGTISLDFRGRGIIYCGAFAILYFDKSEKLVTYVMDDIFC